MSPGFTSNLLNKPPAGSLYPCRANSIVMKICIVVQYTWSSILLWVIYIYNNALANITLSSKSCERYVMWYLEITSNLNSNSTLVGVVDKMQKYIYYRCVQFTVILLQMKCQTDGEKLNRKRSQPSQAKFCSSFLISYFVT